MPKRSPLKKAKDNAWAAFSLFIRTRDSLKTTGSLDGCLCVTCDKWYPRLGVGCIQAGHFIAGRNNAVLFSEKGVHGQCYGCNNGSRQRGKSAHIKYWLFMEQEYGRELIDKLILESNQTVKYKVWEFEEIEQRFKTKTELLIEKSRS